jgi:high-affinity Fe2+/Pb2+ permease
VGFFLRSRVDSPDRRTRNEEDIVKRYLKFFAILAPLALLSACSKAPAEAAIKAADQAVEAARPVAEKLVPDQMKSLNDALADAHDKFSKGDYAAALTAAKDIPTKANEVVAAAKAKKDELTKTWEGIAREVPAMVAGIAGKVTELSAMKKLPKGMDKAKVEGAKSALDGINQTWNAATDAVKAGNWNDAIQKGGEAKAKALEVMSSLGVTAAAPAPAGQPAPAK